MPALQRDCLHVLEEGDVSTCEAGRLSHCPERIGFGLGWSILEYPGGTVLLQSGSDRGKKSIAHYLKEQRKGAGVFTNGAYGFRIYFEVRDPLFESPDAIAFLRSSACRAAESAGVELEECRKTASLACDEIRAGLIF